MAQTEIQNPVIKIFPAMSSRNYQYYFVGQLISQIGTWLQIVAQGWLVLQLSHSALQVGLVAACATLPSFLFSLFGGVIVDRFNKKYLIVITQTLSMVLALILGVLAVTNVISVWHIAILAFALGVVGAVDMPARQAFVSEMVESDKVASAIALNAGIFNAARVIGPSVAGILIAIVGVGGAFILNGVSYIAAIIVQFLIIPKIHQARVHPHPFRAIKDGVSYTASHPLIRSLLILTAVVSIFGWSYTTVMPILAQNVFHVGAAGLGYLYAASGLGALVATVVVSSLSSKISSTKFIIGGNILFALSMIGFSFVSNIVGAYVFLFFAGCGLLSAFSVINARIQHLVEPEFRGRVLSVYLLFFVGLFPVGNFQIGLLSEHFGAQVAIRLGSVIVLLAAVLAYFLRDKVSRAHDEYVDRMEATEGAREVIVDSRKS